MLPQSVLHEFMRSWVLWTSQRIVLVIDNPDHGLKAAPSPTLGVTDGTPRVLNSFKLPANPLSFLSQAVPVLRDEKSLVAVDITGERENVNLGVYETPVQPIWSVVCNKKWLVFYGRYGALTVWRLNNGFPEGVPRDLDVSHIEAQSGRHTLRLFMTHSRLVESIADGDELCVAITNGCNYGLRIIDIQRSFDSGALTVDTKEINVDSTLTKFMVNNVWINRERKMFVKLKNLSPTNTVIQDVTTGESITLQAKANVSRVDDSHYAKYIATKCGIYQTVYVKPKMINVVGRGDGVGPPVTAQRQALALLCCYNQPQSPLSLGNPPTSSSPLRAVPQSILRDIAQAWVLPTDRRVVLVITNNQKHDDVIRGKHPFVTMFVAIGVSFTLGITQGPSVTWSGMSWEVALGFLSQTAVMWFHCDSPLCVTDLSSGSTCELVPSGVRSVVHNSKWLVVSCRRETLRIWKLNQSLREGEPLELNIVALRKLCWFAIPTVFLTHSQPVECIAEGDELCIATDERDHCCLRIVDISKCFETRELVVTRQYSTPRNASRGSGETIIGVLSDRNGGLHVAFRVSGISSTVIHDVATGQCTVLPAANSIVSVDSAHFGINHYLPKGNEKPAAKNGIYEIGSNEIVREWVGNADRHWGGGLLFTKEDDGMITCSEAISGIHIVSFSVCSDNFRVSHPFSIS